MLMETYVLRTCVDAFVYVQGMYRLRSYLVVYTHIAILQQSTLMLSKQLMSFCGARTGHIYTVKLQSVYVLKQAVLV
jgi:hypothetical protein